MSATQIGFISGLQPPKWVPLNSIAAPTPMSLADFTINCGDMTVTLVTPLEVRLEFFCRGTVVYNVRMRKKTDRVRRSGAGDIEEEAAVVKPSWQVTTPKAEWD
ncbi:hypothetical protein FRB98_005199 [Tulasnella sp. 332]|nr:hypothetical protein FRB98_005199 [Tulasnella sp. 332]